MAARRSAKKTSKKKSASRPKAAKVKKITKVVRPVVARKTRIVGRTEPETLARAMTEPVVWEEEIGAPVEVTVKKKRIRRAS
ncbi:MAG TPA: hypothetical protein VFI72_16125 [Candidatus Angelobacter sp.]|nr:hypothetical protein [Candidatus Angelobacter sp.]